MLMDFEVQGREGRGGGRLGSGDASMGGDMAVRLAHKPYLPICSHNYT